MTKYVDRLGRDCNKSPHSPLFNVVRRKLAVQLLSFVLYCVSNHSLRTYSNIEMGEGGYKLFLQLVAKTNLSDLSVSPFNVTDCSSKRVTADFSLDSTHGSMRNRCFLTNFPFVQFFAYFKVDMLSRSLLILDFSA